VKTYSKRQISTHVLTCFNYTSYVLHSIQYHILCTSTNVNIGIPISKTAPETYCAEGLMMTC